MFNRRKQQKVSERLYGWVRPQSGWKRAWRYIMHRLARLPGTSYSIAAGFACGAAISFTPFVGLHIVISGLLAWIIRGNILASAIGTIVGNPWTFPFIWVWLYESGNWILRNSSEKLADKPDFYASFNLVWEAMLRLDVSTMIEAVSPVVWPMFLSGIPTAIFVWVVFYFPLVKLIDGYQHRRIRRLQQRAEKRQDPPQF